MIRSNSGAWTLLRRPLLLLVFVGATVSLQASGRFSARLMLDGMVAYAFVPVFEMASLAFVYRRAPRRVTMAQAMDLFFAANAPWLLWMLAFNAVRAMLTPEQASGTLNGLFWLMPLSGLAAAGWSTYIDWHFFRETLSPDPSHAGRELLLQRAISWTCIVGYFAGHEVWQQIAVWINV